MTSIEILFASVGFIAGVVGVIVWHLTDLDKLLVKWKEHILKYDKCFATVEEKRLDDLCKLAALEQRVRVLEERLDSEALEFPDPEDEGIVI